MSTPRHVFSSENFVGVFQAKNIYVSRKNIYNYLDYMTKSMLIAKVDKYDVKEKILSKKFKYYLTVLAFSIVML